VEATAEICRPAEARVIILTTFDRTIMCSKACAPGDGYLLKDLSAQKLFETIRKVHTGEPFIQPKSPRVPCGRRCMRPTI